MLNKLLDISLEFRGHVWMAINLSFSDLVSYFLIPYNIGDSQMFMFTVDSRRLWMFGHVARNER